MESCPLALAGLTVDSKFTARNMIGAQKTEIAVSPGTTAPGSPAFSARLTSEVGGASSLQFVQPAIAVAPIAQPSAQQLPTRAAFNSNAAYRVATCVFKMGQELRCPVCLSLFKNATLSPCGHTYCKSCIVSWLNRSDALAGGSRGKGFCPICKTGEITLRKLRPDAVMDELVRLYRGLQPPAALKSRHDGRDSGVDADEADTALPPVGSSCISIPLHNAGGADVDGGVDAVHPQGRPPVVYDELQSQFTQLPALTQIYDGFVTGARRAAKKSAAASAVRRREATLHSASSVAAGSDVVFRDGTEAEGACGVAVDSAGGDVSTDTDSDAGHADISPPPARRTAAVVCGTDVDSPLSAPATSTATSADAPLLVPTIPPADPSIVVVSPVAVPSTSTSMRSGGEALSPTPAMPPLLVSPVVAEPTESHASTVTAIAAASFRGLDRMPPDDPWYFPPVSAPEVYAPAVTATTASSPQQRVDAVASVDDLSLPVRSAPPTSAPSPLPFEATGAVEAAAAQPRAARVLELSQATTPSPPTSLRATFAPTLSRTVIAGSPADADQRALPDPLSSAVTGDIAGAAGAGVVADLILDCTDDGVEKEVVSCAETGRHAVTDGVDDVRAVRAQLGPRLLPSWLPTGRPAFSQQTYSAADVLPASCMPGRRQPRKTTGSTAASSADSQRGTQVSVPLSFVIAKPPQMLAPTVSPSTTSPITSSPHVSFSGIATVTSNSAVNGISRSLGPAIELDVSSRTVATRLQGALTETGIAAAVQPVSTTDVQPAILLARTAMATLSVGASVDGGVGPAGEPLCEPASKPALRQAGAARRSVTFAADLTVEHSAPAVHAGSQPDTPRDTTPAVVSPCAIYSLPAASTTNGDGAVDADGGLPFASQRRNERASVHTTLLTKTVYDTPLLDEPSWALVGADAELGARQLLSDNMSEKTVAPVALPVSQACAPDAPLVTGSASVRSVYGKASFTVVGSPSSTFRATPTAANAVAAVREPTTTTHLTDQRVATTMQLGSPVSAGPADVGEHHLRQSHAACDASDKFNFSFPSSDDAQPLPHATVTARAATALPTRLARTSAAPVGMRTTTLPSGVSRPCCAVCRRVGILHAAARGLSHSDLIDDDAAVADDDEDDALVVCNGCQVYVHAECYGIDDAALHSAWQCALCEAQCSQSDVSCVLCPRAACVGALKPAVIEEVRRFSGRSNTEADASAPTTVNTGGVSESTLLSLNARRSLRDATGPTPQSGDYAYIRAVEALLPHSFGDRIAEAWRPTLDGRWVHAVCVSWIPEAMTSTSADIAAALHKAASRWSASTAAAAASLANPRKDTKVKRPAGNAASSRLGVPDVLLPRVLLVRAGPLSAAALLSQGAGHSSSDKMSAVAARSVRTTRRFPVRMSQATLAAAAADVEASSAPATLIALNVEPSALPPPRVRLACGVCGLRGADVGAVVQCSAPACRNAYHATCALHARDVYSTTLAANATGTTPPSTVPVAPFMKLRTRSRGTRRGLSNAFHGATEQRGGRDSRRGGRGAGDSIAAETAVVQYVLLCPEHAGQEWVRVAHAAVGGTSNRRMPASRDSEDSAPANTQSIADVMLVLAQPAASARAALITEDNAVPGGNDHIDVHRLHTSKRRRAGEQDRPHELDMSMAFGDVELAGVGNSSDADTGNDASPIPLDVRGGFSDSSKVASPAAVPQPESSSLSPPGEQTQQLVAAIVDHHVRHARESPRDTRHKVEADHPSADHLRTNRVEALGADGAASRRRSNKRTAISISGFNESNADPTEVQSSLITPVPASSRDAPRGRRTRVDEGLPSAATARVLTAEAINETGTQTARKRVPRWNATPVALSMQASTSLQGNIFGESLPRTVAAMSNKRGKLRFSDIAAGAANASPSMPERVASASPATASSSELGVAAANTSMCVALADCGRQDATRVEAIAAAAAAFGAVVVPVSDATPFTHALADGKCGGALASASSGGRVRERAPGGHAAQVATSVVPTHVVVPYSKIAVDLAALSQVWNGEASNIAASVSPRAHTSSNVLLFARRRSHRYLCALLCGAAPVASEWLEACAAPSAAGTGILVHESPYLCAGDKVTLGDAAGAVMLLGPRHRHLSGQMPYDTIAALVANATDASKAAALPRKRPRGVAHGAAEISNTVTTALLSTAPTRVRTAIASGDAGQLLLAHTVVLLWGEFECPPKNTTREHVRELVGLAGGGDIDEVIGDLASVPRSVTRDAVLRTAADERQTDAGMTASSTWSSAVRRAIAQRTASAIIRPVLIVLCDEPHFTFPPCLDELNSLAPGLAAMARPEWLLDSCGAYAWCDPASPPYVHPSALPHMLA